MNIEPPRAYAKEAAVVRALCFAAGEVALAASLRPLTIDYKDGDSKSPVTNADQAVNALLMKGLRDAFADDAFCAEEDASTHSYAGRQDAARTWCLDPIDGTREYIAKSGQYAVMVGLAVHGEARFGAVYEVAKGHLYMGAVGSAGRANNEPHAGSRAAATGRAGAGAAAPFAAHATASWASVEADGETSALSVSTQAEAHKARLMVSRHQRNKTLDVLCRDLGITSRTPLGSVGLKVSRLAAGTADLYACVTDKIHEWDGCGPAAILLGAGGEVTDLAGRPLRFNQETTSMKHGLLASNKWLHAEAVAALAKAAEELPHLAKLLGPAR